MFGLAFSEVIVIAVLALIAFGDENLPTNIRKFAKWFSSFRSFIHQTQRSWYDVQADVTRSLLTESQEDGPSAKDESSSFEHQPSTLNVSQEQQIVSQTEHDALSPQKEVSLSPAPQ